MIPIQRSRAYMDVSKWSEERTKKNDHHSGTEDTEKKTKTNDERRKTRINGLIADKSPRTADRGGFEFTAALKHSRQHSASHRAAISFSLVVLRVLCASVVPSLLYSSFISIERLTTVPANLTRRRR